MDWPNLSVTLLARAAAVGAGFLLAGTGLEQVAPYGDKQIWPQGAPKNGPSSVDRAKWAKNVIDKTIPAIIEVQH